MGQTAVSGSAAVFGEPERAAPTKRCGDARRAVVHYRGRVWHWQRLRDADLADRSPIARGKTCRWTHYAVDVHRGRATAARTRTIRVLDERRRVPVGEAELRAYIGDDCLEEIVDRESADTWSPSVHNYQGSGAYGLPQALPGRKMASAGSDWRTNPKTQIRWMRGYVNSRYGGSCGALAHHNANGWY